MGFFRRAYRILAGAITSLSVCLAIALYFDHSALSHYARMLRTHAIGKEFIPTVGVLLRMAIDRNAFWLQFLPAIVACVLAVWFVWLHRNDWDWVRHGSILILVSALAAPYAWFTDQAVVWPALLYGFYVASRAYRTALLALMGAATAQMLSGLSLHSALFIWPCVAWLAWYLFAVRASDQVCAVERKVPELRAMSSGTDQSHRYVA